MIITVDPSRLPAVDITRLSAHTASQYSSLFPPPSVCVCVCVCDVDRIYPSNTHGRDAAESGVCTALIQRLIRGVTKAPEQDYDDENTDHVMGRQYNVGQ